MRAERTRYAVPGWGVGELWTSERLVLAHDFDFGATAAVEAGGAVAAAPGAAPFEGAHGPPTGTVSEAGSRVVDGFVPNVRRSSRRVHAAPGTAVRVDPQELVGRFEAFLAGENVPLDDIPLDLGWCTSFQHAVATALHAVPRGEVVSYGELAALAGYPGAQRAVGTFCARNRFMLLLPCHRVIGASGIGSYGAAGVPVKRRLLALEDVAL